MATQSIPACDCENSRVFDSVRTVLIGTILLVIASMFMCSEPEPAATEFTVVPLAPVFSFDGGHGVEMGSENE